MIGHSRQQGVRTPAAIIRVQKLEATLLVERLRVVLDVLDNARPGEILSTLIELDVAGTRTAISTEKDTTAYSSHSLIVSSESIGMLLM
jgi:hypothetical protein